MIVFAYHPPRPFPASGRGEPCRLRGGDESRRRRRLENKSGISVLPLRQYGGKRSSFPGSIFRSILQSILQADFLMLPERTGTGGDHLFTGFQIARDFDALIQNP